MTYLDEKSAVVSTLVLVVPLFVSSCATMSGRRDCESSGAAHRRASAGSRIGEGNLLFKDERSSSIAVQKGGNVEIRNVSYETRDVYYQGETIHALVRRTVAMKRRYDANTATIKLEFFRRGGQRILAVEKKADELEVLDGYVRASVFACCSRRASHSLFGLESGERIVRFTGSRVEYWEVRLQGTPTRFFLGVEDDLDISRRPAWPRLHLADMTGPINDMVFTSEQSDVLNVQLVAVRPRKRQGWIVEERRAYEGHMVAWLSPESHAGSDQGAAFDVVLSVNGGGNFTKELVVEVRGGRLSGNSKRLVEKEVSF